jgi:hypothetical protein
MKCAECKETKPRKDFDYRNENNKTRIILDMESVDW